MSKPSFSKRQLMIAGITGGIVVLGLLIWLVTTKFQASSSSKQGITTTPQNCGGEYVQCGGTGWLGANCCQSGFQCVKINDDFSQCLPRTDSTQQSTTLTVTTTSVPFYSMSENTVVTNPGNITQVGQSVANSTIYGVNASGDVYTYSGTSWNLLTDTVKYKQFFIRKNGEVVGLTTDGKICYKADVTRPCNFANTTEIFSQIHVATNTDLYFACAIKSNNEIYYSTSSTYNTWTLVNTSVTTGLSSDIQVKQVAITGLYMYILNTNGDLYYNMYDGFTNPVWKKIVLDSPQLKLSQFSASFYKNQSNQSISAVSGILEDGRICVMLNDKVYVSVLSTYAYTFISSVGVVSIKKDSQVVTRWNMGS